MHFVSYIITLLTLVTVLSAEEVNKDAKILTYTEDEFTENIPNKPHFIKFFAPWCGHCKRLAPTWDDLANQYNTDDKVIIAKVDCTQETKLCSDQGVTGYPTLKFYNKDVEESVRYKGGRDLEALAGFVEKQLNPEAAGSIKREEESQKAGDVKQQREAAGDAPPEVVDPNYGLIEATDDNFEGVVDRGYSFVMFYAPWCGHCKRAAPTWQQLGMRYDTNTDINIVKVDCTRHKETCTKYEVKGFPTITWFKDGEKVKDYKGPRSLEDLSTFVKTEMGLLGKEEPAEPQRDATEGQGEERGKDKEEQKKGKEEEKKDKEEPVQDQIPPPPSSVMELTTDTFDEQVKTGTTFVKFYAPWCGHCKRLVPTWNDLGDKFLSMSNVRIAKVDCTSNRELCQQYEVKGYPTLKLFQSGEEVSKYQGSRELDKLAKFVMDSLPHDEL